MSNDGGLFSFVVSDGTSSITSVADICPDVVYLTEV